VRDYKCCVAAALMGLALGCGAPRRQQVATYMAPMLAEAMPSRIVVVPFDGPSCSADAKAMVTESVAQAIQSVLLGEIIMAPMEDHRLAAEGALHGRGRIDLNTLIDARKRYNADAFLFGAVTQYKAYDPPIVGLNLRMLSARTGEVMWAVEAVFDAHRQEVRRKVEIYFRNSGLRKRLGGPELIFISPRLFSRFVAAEVVRPLREGIPAREHWVATGK